ncbi:MULTISPECIES: PDZ domain-containing protein [unclassified Rhodococcus (in: high G+C Gram-positive bacteria)]|uniref:YlbL family protein n=1 Tax=unclassified Rhodococcus (in: high G+C Gram-positive bacteria) TaxID=192944 RepID=UPI00163A7A4F|nr:MULTISPECIES: PDZ domain-containing protein [unclassified Rhodococcus (in: high G+C Gram-positive bacteria)]MBC2643592.1 PDZ domain-containing protein [Rhodococcus sp. 3A]MBC2891667.1 PDZ domain-containing protein [Rhodococcus sp. 4CII]
MNRRIVTLLAALAPIVVLGILGTVIKVPFVALGPGPTFNTLGEVGGEQVVAIQGTEVDETTGHLNMTTVAVRDDLNVFEAFGLWASGRQGIVPREEVYPPDKSKDEVKQENDADFQQSEDSAELAALHFLGKPVDLRVAKVAEDGPSAGILREGDGLVSVDGTAVSTVGDVQEAVAEVAPNTEVPILVRRDGAETTVRVTVGARPGDESKGYLGITPEEVPDVPFTVDFNLADVGGPSAGLMFTLAVIDKLSPGELNGGKFVAGTGTIDSDGDVGPIGGIKYKLIAADEAGAETFLVPAKNCDEARQGAPDGLRLVKVETLAGAVDALETIDAGGDAPGC